MKTKFLILQKNEGPDSEDRVVRACGKCIDYTSHSSRTIKDPRRSHLVERSVTPVSTPLLVGHQQENVPSISYLCLLKSATLT